MVNISGTLTKLNLKYKEFLTFKFFCSENSVFPQTRQINHIHFHKYTYGQIRCPCTSPLEFDLISLFKQMH